VGSGDVFRSKIDWWLILLLVVPAILPVATELTKHGVVPAAASRWMPTIVLALLAAIFFPVRYVIEGTTVSIQCGLIGWGYRAFSVSDVQGVRPTHKPLSSPALSLDRLEIDLGFRGAILISPRDKAGFLTAMQTLNPELRLRDGSLVRGG
jgi:hypothetical protein